MKHWWMCVPLLLGSASAFQGDLTENDIQKALNEGQSMVSGKNGYLVGPYLLHEYNAGIRLKASDPEVDAVLVTTPFERIRYSSYLQKFQLKSLSAEEARSIAVKEKNTIGFTVFTHSPISVEEELEQFQLAYEADPTRDDGVQHSYMDQFSDATLEIAGKVLSGKKTLDGPYRDQFSIEGARPEFRFLGVVTYSFDLSGLQGNETGVLRFKDSQGKDYTEQVDLQKFY